ncbi:spore germination lipoprotein GerD [Paenibacillus sp. 1P03SA]|uniref:spore germination lipoprotein GerD n=1 Tax=Paenibacillus sp. 1P03SA TaxID=3132294 RepID=UPI0039A3CB62
MNRKTVRYVPALFAVFLLASCSSDNSSQGSSSSQGNYKETKSMVLDILKSDEGRAAIDKASRSSLSSAGSGNSSVSMLTEGQKLQMQTAVKDVLTSTESSKFVRDMMKDPRFAGDFAKVVSTQDKQLHKDLMKDPEYQKQLLQIMKNPEYQQLMMELTRTTQYRQQMMNVIQESFQSPLFQAQMLTIMRKVMEEGIIPKEAGGQGQGGQGGGQGGQGGKGGQGGGEQGGQGSGGEGGGQGEQKNKQDQGQEGDQGEQGQDEKESPNKKGKKDQDSEY